MLLIARGSRRFAASFRQRAQTIRVVSGVLMAGAALVIYQGWAESLQKKVPGYAQWLQDAIEGNSTAKHKLDRLAGRSKPVFVARERRLASRLEVGTAWVNHHRATSATVPFGGAKESGIGRVYSEMGLKAYLEPRVVSVLKNA